MRLLYLFVLAIAVSACGPSSGQIRAAKSARYNAPAKSVLDVALQVAQRTYKIGAMDFDTLEFATVPQWYSRDGGRISPNNDGKGDFVNAGGGDVQMTLFVKVKQVDGGSMVVVVTARTFELIAGSPQPRELMPDDPGLPPWVLGRIDSLAIEIHGEAQKLFPTS